MSRARPRRLSFFFNDTATTEIYTLSLHDALPIWPRPAQRAVQGPDRARRRVDLHIDRKSTRLNSSHVEISYAVFCLKKKNHDLLDAQDRRCGQHVIYQRTS